MGYVEALLLLGWDPLSSASFIGLAVVGLLLALLGAVVLLRFLSAKLSAAMNKFIDNE